MLEALNMKASNNRALGWSLLFVIIVFCRPNNKQKL